MKASKICTQAAELVSGDREQQHGDKKENHENIARLWNAYACTIQPGYLTALDVANMMELLKIARRKTGEHNDDDYIDAAGYAGVAGEIAER
jgi:hypothetical protein